MITFLFLQIDWDSMLRPSVHLGEIFIRGTVVYLFLFSLLRIVRREAGALGISDLLVIVLIADAAQNAMASEYKSLPEGLVLVATIVFWDYFLDWLSYRFPRIRRVLRAAPLLLIKDGRMHRRNLRHEMITEEELMGQLREQGLEDVQQVKKAYMEGDGQISVIPRDGKDGRSNKPKKTPV